MPYHARRGMIEKQHTCNGCGCVFRYAMDPQDWRTRTMTQTMKPRDAIRCHPCPDCGLYQPEMVMWLKWLHPVMFLLGLFMLLVAASVGLANNGPNAVLGAQIGAGAFIVFALVQLATAMSNPNADLAANRALAEKEMKDGLLDRVSGGDPESAAPAPRNLGVWHVPGLLAVLAGPAGFVLSIVMFSNQTASLPVNPDLTPSVVTAGKRVSYTFDKCTAEGVSGNLWRGTPTVRVLNAKSLGISETLPGTGSDQQWGKTFKVRKGVGNQPIKPTIWFTLPKNEKLANQTVRLSVSLPMTYPVMSRGNGFAFDSKQYFDDRTSTASAMLEVKVAESAVVEARQQAILVGVAGGAAALFGGLWLTCVAWALLWRSSKCEVVSEEPPAPEPSRCPSDYGMPGMAGHPALDDFDRSKWGQRRLR